MHVGVPLDAGAETITFGCSFLEYQGPIRQTSRQEKMIVVIHSFHVGAKSATLLTLLV
jgi:hypothetical protein